MLADTDATDTARRRKAAIAVVRRSEAFGGVVQAQDLRHALRALLRRPGAPTQRVLALRSGVAERTVSRILHGHDHTTRFDIADALLVALDQADVLDELTVTGSEDFDG
jgi:hypothetical protein